MATFMYAGHYYEGINPSGLTFQRQSDLTSCWAACLINARSALLGLSDVTDQDILSYAFPGYKIVALNDKETLEMILYVSHITGVTTTVKELFPTNVEQAFASFNNALTTKGMPALLGLTPKSGGMGHMVLVLASGGQLGMDYLVYDPWYDARLPRIQAFMTSGLKVLSYDTLLSHKDNYVVPLTKRVVL